MSVKQWIAHIILTLFKWKVTGDDVTTPRGLFVVVPHTHWLDVPLGLLVRQKLGIRVHFMAKKSLFQGFSGVLFRRLGGYPVDRTRRQGLVRSAVEAFQKGDIQYLAIAPEGTRQKVDHLKTGFFYIAAEGQIPMYLSAFDYKNRQVKFTGPIWADITNPGQIEEIEHHFRGIEGRVPEYSF
ncbi:MAG TPA: 1-acyl-sn-glycerol-3-phosphate acyltransferase [Membranihabitans sp.]|nr:1-acyl-sn-glycerol-3-phosphate acyltransferase [Membranihabitans sp.]